MKKSLPMASLTANEQKTASRRLKCLEVKQTHKLHTCFQLECLVPVCRWRCTQEQCLCKVLPHASVLASDLLSAPCGMRKRVQTKTLSPPKVLRGTLRECWDRGYLRTGQTSCQYQTEVLKFSGASAPSRPETLGIRRWAAVIRSHTYAVLGLSS